MRAPRRVELLADAAHMYYMQGLTQQQVAEALETTRSNVSRMLNDARAQGIVSIEVNRPLFRHRDLELSLMQAFGIHEAIVLDGRSDRDTMPELGELAAKWLVDELKDGIRLTLSWGRTLQAVVHAVPSGLGVDVEVGQIGGDSQLDPKISGHELVKELAARCGGRYSYLHAPAILDSSETARELRSLRGIEAEFDKARSADIALVGIGAYGHGFAAQLLESAHLTPEERAAFDALGPAGDIMARFFDDHGRQLDTPLRDRVLALELDDLHDIPKVVGIAGGAEKGPGIWGALQAGWINVLVTDQEAATTVLDLEQRKRESPSPAA